VGFQVSKTRLWGAGYERIKVRKGVRFYRDIIGQADIVARLKAFTDLFSASGGAPGHILLIGDDGMGKASFAIAVADELDVGFQEVDAASLEIIGDVTALMTNLKLKQVLLLTNIHQLRKVTIERFRESLHEGKLTINIGQGPAMRKFAMELSPFTLVATCTKKADCPAELLREFSLVLSLQPYSTPELQALAESIGKTEGISLDAGAAALIAKSCDGRPGHIESMLRRVVRAVNKSALTVDDVQKAFDAFGINVRPDTTPNVSDNLQNLSGQDFEKLIETLLTRIGFQAEMTKTTGDGGIDIIAKLDKPIFGGLYLFQCKRFAPDNLVGAPTVRDFYGAVTADRAVKGILITTSDFTAQAREFAQRVGVELIDITQLQKLFVEYGLNGMP
jgi:Holliday junction resolvasome RuvABC ATP-dependent DNA helicase subunit